MEPKHRQCGRRAGGAAVAEEYKTYPEPPKPLNYLTKEYTLNHIRDPIVI